ncbi:hypothetical protein ACEK06_11390 [Pseudomonas brenneri]|uniref:hypothetical protein n=1 Tax=Pseudomonas TaxID=286 RepID=UPI001472BA09|nr:MULTISPECIES: hypothetical protein [Pseudomonas]NMY32670.1 hypothetical protein [Pseudomonas sp. WS 5412]NWD59432.1 hypothetical protein [Pseudomonas veronii]
MGPAEKNDLLFEIKNITPVSAEDYSGSLQALAEEYRRFLAVFESPEDSVATQLYVHEVRAGSIVSLLTPIAVGVLPLLDCAKSMLEYSDYLKAILDWALGKAKDKPKMADEQKTLKGLVKIIEPTAKDHGSQMNIGVVNFHGAVSVNINLGSVEANAAQNFLTRHMDKAKEKESLTGDHNFVALKWFQTRNELKNKTGDKARIESISPDPVKVLFGSDDLKNRMVINEVNIYHKAFIVDVHVETVDGKPILYLVKALHETLDIAS